MQRSSPFWRIQIQIFEGKIRSPPLQHSHQAVRGVLVCWAHWLFSLTSAGRNDLHLLYTLGVDQSFSLNSDQWACVGRGWESRIDNNAECKDGTNTPCVSINAHIRIWYVCNPSDRVPCRAYAQPLICLKSFSSVKKMSPQITFKMFQVQETRSCCAAGKHN